jgi:hypothetical protein
MTRDKSYPIYLLFGKDGEIKVRLFIRWSPNKPITNHHTHYVDVPVDKINITVNTMLVNLGVYLKKNFTSCTPVITKQSYLWFPINVRNFFNNHPIVKDITCSLKSLTIANMFKADKFYNGILYYLPDDIFETMYSVDQCLLKYGDANATVNVTISKTKPKCKESRVIVVKKYKSI